MPLRADPFSADDRWASTPPNTPSQSQTGSQCTMTGAHKLPPELQYAAVHAAPKAAAMSRKRGSEWSGGWHQSKWYMMKAIQAASNGSTELQLLKLHAHGGTATTRKSNSSEIPGATNVTILNVAVLRMEGELIGNVRNPDLRP
mmetsp:Transcript_18106/g.46302  ORF Transcript_18106/g.46302 Transcript_18106/m.46302 type:complete len:144 (-) Transcript_18106:247-678(-)